MSRDTTDLRDLLGFDVLASDPFSYALRFGLGAARNTPYPSCNFFITQRHRSSLNKNKKDMGTNKNDQDTSQPLAKDKYPAPKVFEPPEDIKKTLPTEEDLNDLVPLFTWGELKDIISESTAKRPLTD